MKKLTTGFVCLAIAVLMLGASANAQSRDLVKVTLPETVQAGSMTVPAGDYEVSALDTTSDLPVLLFRSSQTSFTVRATREPLTNLRPAERTEFVFLKGEDGLVLDRIVIGGKNYAYRLR